MRNASWNANKHAKGKHRDQTNIRIAVYRVQLRVRISMSWIHNAACRGKNPDYWHPPDGQPWLIHKGIKICQTCPVKQQCLEYALSFTPIEDNWGIYAGYTAKQRHEIRSGKKPTKFNSRKKQIITGLDDVERME